MILCILLFDITTGNLIFSAFVETKIIRGEQHGRLYSFEIDVLVASHCILLPDLMYVKYSHNRSGRLIRRDFLLMTETETFQ